MFPLSSLVGVSGGFPFVKVSRSRFCIVDFAEADFSIFSPSPIDFRPSPMIEGDEEIGVESAIDGGCAFSCSENCSCI